MNADAAFNEDHMTPSRLRIILLTFALIAGGSMIIWAGATKSYITHDESISYLAAAAKQGQFDAINAKALAPVTTWVTAPAWKQFFQPAETLAFRQIGIDLAETDIHPPLYFWLLHIWVLFWGVHPWTGPFLNLFLHLIGGLCLFGLAASVLTNQLEQAVVVFVWALSPAVIELTLWARQYALFGITII